MVLWVFPWLCIFLFGRFFYGLLWAFVGYSLDLRGLVLFVSYFSDGHDLGFHFFSFVGGLRGAEPSSILGDISFLC